MKFTDFPPINKFTLWLIVVLLLVGYWSAVNLLM